MCIEFEVDGDGNASASEAEAEPAVEEKPEPVAEPEPAPEPAAPSEPVPAPVAVAGPAVARAPGTKPLASPAVRQRARAAGVDLYHVAGSGPAGRISHADLDVHLSGGAVSYTHLTLPPSDLV